MGVLITLLVCVSGSYATNPDLIASNNSNTQQADQTVTDSGYSVDDSGWDDSGWDDSGLDDSGLDDSGLDDSGLDDSGLDDSGLDDSGWDDSGLDDSGLDDSGWDDSGWDDSGWDDSGWDDSGWDDSGLDDSGLDDSGLDDSGLDDSYTIEHIYMYFNDSLYKTLSFERFNEMDDSGAFDDLGSSDALPTADSAEYSANNILLAAGSDDVDVSDDGSNEGTDDGYGNSDDTGIYDGFTYDNGTDIYYNLVVNNTVSGNGGNGGFYEEIQNNSLNDTNSIPMQHTGVPTFPAFLGTLSLIGGLVINKKR